MSTTTKSKSVRKSTVKRNAARKGRALAKAVEPAESAPKGKAKKAKAKAPTIAPVVVKLPDMFVDFEPVHFARGSAWANGNMASFGEATTDVVLCRAIGAYELDADGAPTARTLGVMFAIRKLKMGGYLRECGLSEAAIKSTLSRFDAAQASFRKSTRKVVAEVYQSLEQSSFVVNTKSEGTYVALHTKVKSSASIWDRIKAIVSPE